ncbi:MAG: tRNA guanosine(34) transglycosylase Tgt [Verrucomicrobiota bacterium]|nr:tRNA guanosine(34) transglycosylase Tgt [Verrucomicrobiota bacterium]
METIPPFAILNRDPATAARRGLLHTAHGEIQTPIFMPVGTQATVKAITPAQLHEINAQIILGNTYHLNLRPGSELVRDLGGLHKFMGWTKPILTDSGGFQVFSLAKLRKIKEDGIWFRSHLDGAEIFLGPKEVMGIQRNLGSDIAMVIDVCPPFPCTRDVAESAVASTLRWAAQCRTIAADTGMLEGGHHVFAIVQGGVHADLRARCATELAGMDFPGYAIGGVSVGEPEPEMLQQVGASIPHLPWHKPRYVMGVGTPRQLLKMIALGVDMFDCVMPTREARHGLAYTPQGPINLKNNRYRTDDSPLVPGLDNYVCNNFSRAYLRHLIMANEMLAATLLSMHNLHFFLDLMRQAREHITAGNFGPWHQEWVQHYSEQDTNEESDAQQ